MRASDVAGVPLDTFEPCACSPEVDPSSRGIRLAAPATMPVGEGSTFPVFGTYRVGARFLNRFHAMENEIVVVAIDAASHAPRAANLLRAGHEAVPARYEGSDRHLDRAVITGWFNLDLFTWLEGLPRGPARYRVFASVGDIVSNVVTVELAEP